MRRSAALTGLVLILATLTNPCLAAEVAPTYQSGAIGPLAVMRDGRVKPLDTLARLEVRKIYGRERIKLTNPDGTTRETWGPIAAYLDWMARPDAWDDEEFLLVEYPPLKEKLLAGPVKSRVATVAARDGLPDSSRSALKELSRHPVVTAKDLTAAATLAGLADTDRKEFSSLARKLGEGSKYLSPRDLEDARIEGEEGGTTQTFAQWFASLYARHREESAAMGRGARLSPLEERAFEAGERLLAYQTIRGDHPPASPQAPRIDDFDRFVPRPHNAIALKFLADAFLRRMDEDRAVRAPGGEITLATDLDRDSSTVLARYFNDLQKEDRVALFRFMTGLKPGESLGSDTPKVVRNFQAWLRETADWMPMHIFREADPAQLAQAGYPSQESDGLRQAFAELVAAESSAPGRAPEAKASAVVVAARSLGESLESYPAAGKIAAETRFNAIAPFYKAPQCYGAALLLLMISLGVPARTASGPSWLRRGLYSAGILALVAGIGWEIFGFTQRVYISGWAPVTNMYETVIWVALVASVLGVVLEAIYRKTYTALAASGIALVMTVLAYNVPLLDSNIKALPPVLRDNFWLTVHVMTIVSSYAAFALAMGLGLIGVCYYLTATYRRDVGFLELATPLIFAPFLAVLGVGAMHASERGLWPSSVGSAMGYRIGATVAGLGGCMAIVSIGALLGELLSRVNFRSQTARPQSSEPVGVPASGSTITLGAKPTVDEIRARIAATRPALDSRALAMQERASTIKPLANFIYRAMQVGVLLVAAGTFLGGWWADKSWGRFWGWDPKETWALITLLIYIVPLHGRFAGWVNTFGLVLSSVACFLSVVMAWYGVNFVLGVGLHSYGFTEGGGQGVVLATAAGVLSFAGSAWWRRFLAYQVPATAAAPAQVAVA